MIETASSIGLAISAVYLAAGAVVAVLFFTRWLRKFDPLAREGSLGFKLVATPGIIALWPFILLKVFRTTPIRDEDGAEQLRRNHRLAFTIIAIIGSLLFATALAWRAPGFHELPSTEIPPP